MAPKKSDGGPEVKDERGSADAVGNPNFYGTDGIYENGAYGSHVPQPFEEGSDERRMADRQAEFQRGLKAQRPGFKGYTPLPESVDPQAVSAADQRAEEDRLIREAQVAEAKQILGQTDSSDEDDQGAEPEEPTPPPPAP